MPQIKCTFWETLQRSTYYLRRYSSSSNEKCQGGGSYHNALSKEPLATTDDTPNAEGIVCNNSPPAPAHGDPRWPTKCDKCDYQFNEFDTHQVFGRKLMKNKETGEVLQEDQLPVGAMWYCDWYNSFFGPGPDGHSLVVRLPGNFDWNVDGEANNCTRKGDRSHKCWIREGAPPNVTAGKNGNTCSAGAGSIAVPGYHGFLRNGYLVD